MAAQALSQWRAPESREEAQLLTALYLESTDTAAHAAAGGQRRSADVAANNGALCALASHLFRNFEVL